MIPQMTDRSSPIPALADLERLTDEDLRLLVRIVATLLFSAQIFPRGSDDTSLVHEAFLPLSPARPTSSHWGESCSWRASFFKDLLYDRGETAGLYYSTGHVSAQIPLEQGAVILVDPADTKLRPADYYTRTGSTKGETDLLTSAEQLLRPLVETIQNFGEEDEATYLKWLIARLNILRPLIPEQFVTLHRLESLALLRWANHLPEGDKDRIPILDRARQLNREILAFAPADPEATVNLAIVESQSGNHHQALAILDTILDPMQGQWENVGHFAAPTNYFGNRIAILAETVESEEEVRSLFTLMARYERQVRSHNQRQMVAMASMLFSRSLTKLFWRWRRKGDEATRKLAQTAIAIGMEKGLVTRAIQKGGERQGAVKGEGTTGASRPGPIGGGAGTDMTSFSSRPRGPLLLQAGAELARPPAAVNDLMLLIRK